MNDKVLSEILERLRAAGEVLDKLPAEVRVQAFDALWPLIAPDAAESPDKPHRSPAPHKKASHVTGEGAFFASVTHDKPADNVKQIAAYLYSQYGTEPFSLAEVRDLATRVGITIPGRPDMTIKAALEDGKKLFQVAGRDKYAPTVHGEAFLKKTYNVTKGTAHRPTDQK